MLFRIFRPQSTTAESGHAARLNFGDCFAYALAKAKGEPLLFKGDDFHHAGLLRAGSLHAGG